jgi:hypothetical protein
VASTEAGAVSTVGEGSVEASMEVGSPAADFMVAGTGATAAVAAMANSGEAIMAAMVATGVDTGAGRACIAADPDSADAAVMVVCGGGRQRGVVLEDHEAGRATARISVQQCGRETGIRSLHEPQPRERFREQVILALETALEE